MKALKSAQFDIEELDNQIELLEEKNEFFCLVNLCSVNSSSCIVNR